MKAVAAAGAGLSADRARQLADIGFLPGEVVQVLARAWPGGEPLVVGVGQSRFALRRVEAACVEVLAGTPEMVPTPSSSGRGQKIWRCPACQVAVWSNYADAGDAIHFVRVGTLDDPAALPPDIHIFTMSRQPWVVLPEGARSVPEFYDARTEWTAETLSRFKAARSQARKG